VAPPVFDWGVMAIAASLWFDDGLEATIRVLWSEVARRGISGRLHEGPFRPHITLGAWQPFDHLLFERALRRHLNDVPAIELVLGAVGAFPGDPGVVYLQPGMNEGLIHLRRSVHEAADGLGARWGSPHPSSAWFPHCTIAWQLDSGASRSALEFLSGIALPIRGFGVAVGIVDTPAEVELHRVSLASA
jgi:2'-5' RNA ligase